MSPELQKKYVDHLQEQVGFAFFFEGEPRIIAVASVSPRYLRLIWDGEEALLIGANTHLEIGHLIQTLKDGSDEIGTEAPLFLRGEQAFRKLYEYRPKAFKGLSLNALAMS